MGNKDDIQLIKECLKGNQKSFKALYDSYRGYVYTICVRYGILEIEIKDCMQVIFMQIFKSLDRFDSSQSKFKTWMSRIAINQILNHKRKSRIDYTVVSDEKLDLIESNFNVPVESEMNEEFIYKVLSKMPEKYRTAFNLYILDGYQHSEIAEKLNITKGASRILVHRGRVWAIKELKALFRGSLVQKKKVIKT